MKKIFAIIILMFFFIAFYVDYSNQSYVVLNKFHTEILDKKTKERNTHYFLRLKSDDLFSQEFNADIQEAKWHNIQVGDTIKKMNF